MCVLLNLHADSERVTHPGCGFHARKKWWRKLTRHNRGLRTIMAQSASTQKLWPGWVRFRTSARDGGRCKDSAMFENHAEIVRCCYHVINSESVRWQVRSLRHLPISNSETRPTLGAFSFCFKGVCRYEVNPGDWRNGQNWSLNGNRLLPSERGLKHVSQIL